MNRMRFSLTLVPLKNRYIYAVGGGIIRNYACELFIDLEVIDFWKAEPRWELIKLMRSDISNRCQIASFPFGRDEVLLFGGIGYEDDIFRDSYVLDLRKHEIRRISDKSLNQPERFFFNQNAQSGNTYYALGRENVHIFDAKENKWDIVPGKGYKASLMQDLDV